METRAVLKGLLSICAAVVLVIGLAGCRTAADLAEDEVERALEDATGAQVEVGDTGGKLVEGWPADIPMYENVTIESSSSLAEGEYAVMLSTLTTTDAFQDVVDWHKNEFEAQGWTTTTDFAIESGGAPNYTYAGTKDKLEILTNITIDGEKVSIAHQVTTKP